MFLYKEAMFLYKFERISYVLSCAACAGVLAFGLSQPAIAQSTTDTNVNAQADDQTGGQATDQSGTQPDGKATGNVSTLSEFVEDTLKQMGVQAGTAIKDYRMPQKRRCWPSSISSTHRP